MDVRGECFVIWGSIEIKEEKCGGDCVLVMWGRGVQGCLVLVGFEVILGVEIRYLPFEMVGGSGEGMGASLQIEGRGDGVVSGKGKVGVDGWPW